jgi:hypothetical protein
MKMKIRFRLAMVVALVGMLMGGGAARANDQALQAPAAVAPYSVSQLLPDLPAPLMAQISNPIDDAPAPWKVTPLDTKNPVVEWFQKLFNPNGKQAQTTRPSPAAMLDKQALTMLAESAVIAFILLVAVLSIVNHRARQKRLDEEAARKKNKNTTLKQ